MKKELPRLTEAELDLMIAIWEAQGPVQRAYLDEKMKPLHCWADTTILTLLSKLTDKGYLSCKKEGNRNVYEPLVLKDEYRSFANRSFLGRFYGHSVKNMVAALYQADDLEEKDIDELEAFLAEAKRRSRFD